jgi:hypothetical protein
VITLLAAGARVQSRLEAVDWRFCFIGGIANYRWGIPRLTNDLDLTLLTGFGEEERYARALLHEFQARIDSPVPFALQNRVMLLRTSEGFELDVALGALPFEEASVGRSSIAELAPGSFLRTCSAEDLIVHKTFAGRLQDWADVKGVLERQQGRLNWAQIRADLNPLLDLKGNPEALDTLESIRRSVAETLEGG